MLLLLILFDTVITIGFIVITIVIIIVVIIIVVVVIIIIIIIVIVSIIIVIIIIVIAGYEYDGGIIITASHLPFNRNGFKFFTKEGGLEKGDIKIILQRAATAAHAAGTTPHARHSDDALVLDAALNTDPSSAQHVSSVFESWRHASWYKTCCIVMS